MFRVSKVDFLVIGAQKSGTTSFFKYLSDHPNVNASKVKEVHFFDLFYSKGKKWYQDQFHFEKGKLCGECTPFYLMHPDAAPRAFEYSGNLKLIAILRNPVERAWSHYQMNIELGIEKLSFEEALDNERARMQSTRDLSAIDSPFLQYSYASRGRYVEQIAYWLEFFPPERLLLLNYHKFFDKPLTEIQKVYEFLGLSPFDNSLDHIENAGQSSEPIPEEIANRLNDYFRPYNQQLAEKYGIKFE